MFSIFKKLFGQSEPKMAVPAAPLRRTQPKQPGQPGQTEASQLRPTGGQVSGVEVAHLSLAAIVARFPAELKALVLAEPDPGATIALPLPLILKQLASGSVKMSLASLHRQAPPGVLAHLAPGDKRQVEIPLKEIFRHVSPAALKRRADQRSSEETENDFNLFGNSDNPFEIAPTTPEKPPRRDSTTLDFPPPSRIGNIEPGVPLVPSGPPSRIAPPSGLRMSQTTDENHGTNGHGNGNGKAHSDVPPVTLLLSALVSSWPAEICGELLALDPATTVALDGGAVAAGLAKGKVIFTWGELCAGLEPPPAEPTSIDETTALLLPLKIVAPAYLAAAKNGKTERKGVELDESIPSLFSDGREPVASPAIPVQSLAEPEPLEMLMEVPVELPMEVPEIPPAAVLAPPPALVAHEAPATVGEIFGQPDQKEFTPAEIVVATAKLPGVAGAIVALQEGLQVASALPDGMKSEVVAAFLPQIFARLNQYAGEMSLGEVDDLLFTTHGAHCQIYRLGPVYFAVLGQPGTTLPWGDLQLIAAELGRQTR